MPTGRREVGRHWQQPWVCFSLPYYRQVGVSLLNFLPPVRDSNMTCSLISNIDRGLSECDGLCNLYHAWTLSSQVLDLLMEHKPHCSHSNNWPSLWGVDKLPAFIYFNVLLNLDFASCIQNFKYIYGSLTRRFRVVTEYLFYFL